MPESHQAQSDIAVAPDPPGRPAPELERLNDFAGSWHAEGEALPDGPNPGRMITNDSYEWLPGGFYMIDRGELNVEGNSTPHLWVFGYDPMSRTYPIYAFDGAGFMRIYQARVRGRTWTISGQWERGTIAFSQDGKRYTADWELTKDGADWLPLCHVEGTRTT